MGATDRETLSRILADAPKAWGQWGACDEIGALNYLTRVEVKSGVDAIRQHRAFTLGVPVGAAAGDLIFPGRWPARHYMVADKAGFEAGHWQALAGGLEFADDYVSGFAQAGTHCDALGHMWFEDTLWNGYPASSTNGGMTKASIEPIARRGIVGRAVLLDLARFRGKPRLERAETFDHRDLLDCARAQGIEIRPRSILMLRTGWLGALYSNEVRIDERYWEPGLTFTLELERFPAGLNRAVFPTRWKCDSWGVPNRRRRGMGPLSVDLRKRVVSAVREEGMSCRAAAQRFGVSFSSAIRWVAALRERGSYAPLPMGGDTRSQRVEAHTDFLLRLHRREPDLTLNEICDRLERARGEKVSPSMIWRFFDRHDITFKKSPRTRVSRAARTSLSGDGDGSTVNSISIR